MWQELSLVAAVAAGGWMALDGLLAPGRRLRSLPVAAVAACCALWAAGELLLRLAEGPSDAAFARRILFAGICGLSPAWLWMAVRAARPAWWISHPGWMAAAALPELGVYALLFTPWSALFVDLGGSGSGPVFPWHMAYAWSLVVVGTAYLGAAALRLRRASPVRMAALVLGVGLPLAGNVAYNLGRLVYDLPLTDPTPTLLALAVVLFRASVVDSGVALALPVGRREVLEQLEPGILIADLDDRVVDANRSARLLLGTDELLDHRLDALLERTTSEERTLEVRTFPLRGALGVVGKGAVLVDRTREEHAERRLRLAARLEAVGSLTAGIAHEVNNPLAYIRANLSELEKWTRELTAEGTHALPSRLRERADEGPELVAEAQDGIERIARLVERLRGFARDDPASEAQLLDWHQVLARSVAMARVGLPDDAVCSRVDDPPPARACEGEVVQILLNLLVNALQATDGRGPVELSVDAHEGGARLRVLDRGPGIPDDVLPHVFDPFFTTKPAGRGTGLGLSLSYDLARRHGGALEAANRPGGGAVFSLWLPAADALADASAGAAAPGDRPAV